MTKPVRFTINKDLPDKGEYLICFPKEDKEIAKWARSMKMKVHTFSEDWGEDQVFERFVIGNKTTATLFQMAFGTI